MAIRWRKRWAIRAGATGLALLASFLALAWFNPRLTRYVESDEFRAELEKQTARGLLSALDNHGGIRLIAL